MISIISLTISSTISIISITITDYFDYNYYYYYFYYYTHCQNEVFGNTDTLIANCTVSLFSYGSTTNVEQDNLMLEVISHVEQYNQGKAHPFCLLSQGSLALESSCVRFSPPLYVLCQSCICPWAVP